MEELADKVGTLCKPTGQTLDKEMANHAIKETEEGEMGRQGRDEQMLSVVEGDPSDDIAEGEPEATGTPQGGAASDNPPDDIAGGVSSGAAPAGVEDPMTGQESTEE